MSLPRRAPFWCSRRRPRTPRTRSPRIGQDRLQLRTGLVHLSQPEAVHRRQGAAADRYLGGIEALPELDRRLRGRQPEIGQPTDPGRDRDKHQHLGDDRQVTGRRKSQRGSRAAISGAAASRSWISAAATPASVSARPRPVRSIPRCRRTPRPAGTSAAPRPSTHARTSTRSAAPRVPARPDRAWCQQRDQRGTHRRRREDRNVISAARSATIAQARGA